MPSFDFLCKKLKILPFYGDKRGDKMELFPRIVVSSLWICSGLRKL